MAGRYEVGAVRDLMGIGVVGGMWGGFAVPDLLQSSGEK